MPFLSPLWLLALLPWAAFAVWLWVGRRRRQRVPFLPLWEAPPELRRPKKGLEPPPLGLMFALLAMLLGILGAAQPYVRSSTNRGRVTILIDRGASMSATANGSPRFAQLAKDAAPLLTQTFGPGPVELVDVVTGKAYSTNRSDWPTEVATWKRTALDTTPLLRAAVQGQMKRGEPTVILSDRPLDHSSDQLILFPPHQPVTNAGIVTLAYRAKQVMVTLRATSDAQRTLHLTSGDRTASLSATLKPNTDQNVFLDLDPATDTIEAALDGHDDFDADDRAYLVRRQSWPTIEPRTPVSDELRRMIDVYTRRRPASPDAPHLPLARPGDLKPDEPGVLLAPTTGVETPLAANVSTRPHPVTAGVDWPALRTGAATAPADPPGEGWTKLAWAGDRTLVAVRTDGARQLWIGFDSRPFARTPAFVVFWGNVFDWTGGGAETWSASPVSATNDVARRTAPANLPADADPTLWPGLFQPPQGPLATNTGRVHFAAGAPPTTDQLSRLKLPNTANIDLTPWLALAALASLVAATATWEKRRPPAPWSASRLDVEEPTHPEDLVAADLPAHHHAVAAPRRRP
jgi:hypothetical protein